ncbi:MAG: HD domain-containing protein [Bryobacteraceae bacterium]
MKSPTVTDLRAGELATGTFLVMHKDIRPKKGSGDPYLSLVLADRTGEIDAKMWDNVEKVMDTFERDDFIRVKGMPQVFQNRMQFTIHTLGRLAEADVDLGDFFPASARDRGEMMAELRGVIASVGNPQLRGLLEAVFADPEIAGKFERAPAAKTIHHAWLGGLVEHVLSLCALCRLVAPRYPDVDVDLLLTGAILHDIGKIEELTYERSFGYSDDGQLLGHILIGLRMVGEKLRLMPEFPPRLRVLVEHLIASHHGMLEYGSPKPPLCAEAMLLHHLDNLDSKMETVRGAVSRDNRIEGSWTGYVASLERSLLKKEQYLHSQPVEKKDVDRKSKAPADAGSPAAPKTASVFAEQLQQALGKK